MISARDVMRMAVVAAMVLLAAGACQASVFANVSLSVDQGAKAWKAYVTLCDPANETLGLHCIYLDVWGSETPGGPWSGPLDISSRTIKLPKGVTENDIMAVGFLSNTANGTKVGTGYHLFGAMQSNNYYADSDGYTSILMGVGEAAGSHQIGSDGVNDYITYTNPVLVAQGTYTGVEGWINVSTVREAMTLLPASLPLPSSFAAVGPDGVNSGASFYVPEPATLALLAIGGAWLVCRRHGTRTSTKGACMRNALKKMVGPGAAVLALVVAAGACQASVFANVSLSVDQGAKAWKAYVTLCDPANETLGLHGIYLDVWGSVTAGGTWTGPLDISSRTIKLPKGVTENDGMAVGFTSTTWMGPKVGTGYHPVGAMQSNEYFADIDGYTSIVMGVGKAAGSHQIGSDGVNDYITYTNPVLVAQGAYTGTVGWINVSTVREAMTLLPASLSLPTSFSTFYPDGVNSGASFYVPEPATLALLAAGLGMVWLKRRRKA